MGKNTDEEIKSTRKGRLSGLVVIHFGEYKRVDDKENLLVKPNYQYRKVEKMLINAGFLA